MNKKQLSILLIVTMGMMLAAAAQPTSFVISGWVFDANGEPCSGPSVEITNTNTSESWSAETHSDSNYYRLVINSTNVNANDVLQLITTCRGSLNITNHKVTQSEIRAGGLFDFNITLGEGILPDLVVSGIGVHVLNNSVNATIENVGIANITEQFNVSFSVNETTIGNKTILHLDTGNNTTVTFEWLLPQAGEYELCINADAGDEIMESNESNNEYRTKVTIPEIRVIVAIKDVNETIHIKELFLPKNAESTALNITEKACDALNILFNYDGENGTIDGLVEPAVFLYNRSSDNWSSIPLDRYLADGDIIGWSDTSGFTTIQPDLIPGDIRVTSFGSVLYPNTTNRIEVTIENIGILDVSNFTCVLKADNETVDEVEIERLNAMNNITISFVWMPNRTGDYALTVEVDSKYNISESNEANNIITKKVIVAPIPTIHVPTDYPTIQDAIDNAPQNSTIYIRDGVYYINDGYNSSNQILIKNKKHLKIIGESKDVRIVSRTGFINPPGLDVIKILNSNGIELRGFTAEVLNMLQTADNVRNIVIQDSNNITLTNLMLYHKGSIADSRNLVIDIENSKYCNISGNIIHGLGAEAWTPYQIEDGENVGIKLSQSENNLIYSNTIYNLARCIDLGGNNNTIYLNNLFALTKNALCSGRSNHWNSTTLINYSYNGTTRKNYTGNYWDDYNGTDNNNNSDGIGDVPYGIEGSAGAFDYHPLMEPHELTFDLIARGLTRPSILYANRTNTILASVERTGTYPAPEQIYVNLTAGGAEVGSVLITMNVSEHKVVRFGWMPEDVRSYELKVDVRPGGDIKVEEMNETNNGLLVEVEASGFLYADDYTGNITSALDFLNESQFSTGSICGFSTSERAALAITVAGEDPTGGRWKPYDDSLVDYLKNKPKESVAWMPLGTNPSILNGIEDFARMILVITAVGEDPTDFGGVNYLVMLKSYYDGEQFGDRDSVEDDALAILALVSCGEKSQTTNNMITNASKYIKDKQNEDGGWNDVKVTSLVIQALIATGEDEAIRNALNYLENAQEDDGGFSDVETTSYAIQAIVAAGDNPLNYTKNNKNPMDYLLSLQQEDGSFNKTQDMSFYPPRTTSYAIPSLCAIPNPVMLKTIGEDYELPDISVSEVKLEEEEICVNTSYTVTADVRSNGGIFDVDLYSDETLIQRKEVFSVWHDSLSRVEFAWKPNRTGIHNLTVVADSGNRIEELYENNNNATREGINVTLPDLYPYEIITPSEIYVNATNVINVVIKGTTDESFNVTLDADGERIGERRIGGIRKEIKIPFEWRPSEKGAYTLKITADAGGKVYERDDTNNTLERPVTVLLPDLIPTSITAGEIFVNARNKVHVTVEGTAECFNISLIKNGTVVGKTTNVTCYGTENVTVYWKPATLGNHTVTVFVDADYDIEETDETNNTMTGTFEVMLPDLVPEEITPEVLYIDEVNTISVKVNGTAEGFNATLVADEIVDISGPLCYLITPIFNGTPNTSETLSGTTTDSNLTFNITEQRMNWSWADIDTLGVSITSNTSTGFVDSKDTWSVDYVAVVVNYTLNSTDQTLELNASDIVSHGNWSNGNNTYISDDEYATTTGITTLQLDITDTEDAIGNITSVVIKVKQHVVDAVPSKMDTSLKETNLDTYNGTIAFEWLPMKLGRYNLTVSLDSDNDTEETDETNNNMTRSVLVAKRIKLKLLSPLGAEVWSGIHNITWNATYEEPFAIDLLYSPNKGESWFPIAVNESNDGVYEWDTRTVNDGEYMIKVVARCGKIRSEEQSGIFIIQNGVTGSGGIGGNARYFFSDAPDEEYIVWWSEDLFAESASSVVVADGKVFVYCTGEGGKFGSKAYTYLVALDEWNNGTILWATPLDPVRYGSWSSPAYHHGRVFAASGHYMYCIDSDTGDIKWRFRFPDGGESVNGGPCIAHGNVYVGSYDGTYSEKAGLGGHVYCLDEKNGSEVWEQPFKVQVCILTNPTAAYGRIYFGDFPYDRKEPPFNDGKPRIYCVDALTGNEVWNVTVETDVGGSVVAMYGVVYAATYETGVGGGNFYALDADNGSIIWTQNIHRSDSTPACYSPKGSSSRYVYVCGGCPGVSGFGTYCFNTKDGEEKWRKPNLGGWTNSPAVSRDGKVFVGANATESGFAYNGLYCLNALTGDVKWNSAVGGSSPYIADGMVFTIGGDGVVYAFGSKNGTVDLLVDDVDVSPEEPHAGNLTSINATIKNNGTANVDKNFSVALSIIGEVNEEKTKTMGWLKAGRTENIIFEWTPELAGNYHLVVEVNPEGEGHVPESNITNNRKSVDVTVTGYPDLVIDKEINDKFGKIPKKARVGDTVAIEVIITNNGSASTDEGFNVSLSINGTHFTNDRLEKKLGPYQKIHETGNVSFVWTPSTAGTYNLTFMADCDNMINESNESNNIMQVVIVVREEEEEEEEKEKRPGFGPGSGGGRGGGDEGGIGAGSGTGEKGAGTGGMQNPINASGSAEETKKEVFGFPFGNATSGASGGGGTLPLLFIALIVLTVALFYFGYYKEKRAHAKHIPPRASRPEGEKRAYRRDKK